MSKVLDHGYVKLLDFMGGDDRVALAARICYQSMDKATPASNVNLIHRLLKSGHNTPFEHSVFTFYLKCPLFVRDHLVRHRMGSFNIKSLRYCVADREYYVPEDLDKYHQHSHKYYVKQIEDAFDAYGYLIGCGVPKEKARAIIPTAAYTEVLWTLNTWSLCNFLRKRLDKAAQYETRQYAKMIFEIFKDKMPVTAQAFKETLMFSARYDLGADDVTT